MSLPVAQLSCQNCTRRKTRCDKQLPSCPACTKTGIACTAVQRKRLPRGRSAMVTKVSKEQALRNQVEHLESVVARLQQAGKDSRRATLLAASPGAVDDDSTAPGPLVAADFWAELEESVAGLRGVLEDGNPSVHHTEMQDSPVQVESDRVIHCDSNSMLFGSSQRVVSMGPPPEMHRMLLEVYHERVHALFMPVHWPSTLGVLQSDRNGTSIQALRSAIHFTSVCALMDHELEGRRMILSQYRQQAEQAFIDAGLLTTTSLVVLQAFVIYLAGLRACEANAQQWSLTSVAVRLASAMGLKKSHRSPKLSFFQKEIRARLWFSLGVLDMQSAFDRGSRTLLGSSDFEAWPLNLSDTELSDQAVSQYSSEDSRMEMSFPILTYRAGICQRTLAELGLCALTGTERPHVVKAQQRTVLAEFELNVSRLQHQSSIAPTAIGSFAATVAQESLVAMRLLLHRPLHRRCKQVADDIDGFELLELATQVLERSQSKRSWIQYAKWSWFRWVKWYALAVVLAELCALRGGAAGHAWDVAQRSFDDYASIVADTESGLLWRPIANLMQRARAFQTANNPAPQKIVTVGSKGSVDYRRNGSQYGPLDASTSYHEPLLQARMEVLANDPTMDDAVVPETGSDDLSWLHWDLLIDDIETEGLCFDSL